MSPGALQTVKVVVVQVDVLLLLEIVQLLHFGRAVVVGAFEAGLGFVSRGLRVNRSEAEVQEHELAEELAPGHILRFDVHVADVEAVHQLERAQQAFLFGLFRQCFSLVASSAQLHGVL